MAQNVPSWAKGLPNYTLYDKYDVARSGLIDTAETPAQQKALKKDLQKLRAEYLALKAAQAKAKATPKPTVKATNTKKPAPVKTEPKRPSSVKPAPLGTPPAAPRRGNAKPAPLGTPSPKPTGRRTSTPSTSKKSPGKMTPQDAAMKKILEKKYGKIYG